MYGRVEDVQPRLFAIFTARSRYCCAVTWKSGHAQAPSWLIIMRIFQGVGGAFLFANSSGDHHRRLPGRTSGASPSVSTGWPPSAGSFIGLRRRRAPGPQWEWRAGVPGSACRSACLGHLVWAYRQAGRQRQATVKTTIAIDWWGNADCSAVGLISVLTGIVVRHCSPTAATTMGWTNPGWCSPAIFGGHLHLLVALRGGSRRRGGRPDVPICTLFTHPCVQPPGRHRQPARRPRPGVGSSSCSSSGCRASGYRCTATTTPTRRCGRASTCCR